MSSRRVWAEYFPRFATMDATRLRPDCEPFVEGPPDALRSIVLVHGLSDSPWFMRPLSREFAAMGYRVYAPLLEGHGVTAEFIESVPPPAWPVWVDNVAYAIEEARQGGREVSIGGLSTGGTLAVHAAVDGETRIDGGVFLFSPALSIAGLADYLFRLPLVSSILGRFDRPTDLVQTAPWGHPYRYTRPIVDAVEQLEQLIVAIEDRVPEQPLWAVHSEADQTAAFAATEKLVLNAREGFLYRIGPDFQVPHASVLLDQPVLARNGSPLEPANPMFHAMMRTLRSWVVKTGGSLRSVD
ncbi:MAG: alpha/beta fold hydrolase [Myxococcota bacterium]